MGEEPSNVPSSPEWPPERTVAGTHPQFTLLESSWSVPPVDVVVPFELLLCVCLCGVVV